MDIGIMLMFFGISALSYCNCRNSAVRIIEKTTISNMTPINRICDTPNWIKRVFKIRKARIPKYLYKELVMALIFASLGPICFFVYLISGCATNIAGILVMLQAGLIIINLAYLSIMNFILKKTKGDSAY